MRSFSTLVLVLVAGSLLCFSSPAGATTIFQDDFESHTGRTVTVGNQLSSLVPLIGESYTTTLANESGVPAVIADVTTAPGPGETNSGNFIDLKTMSYNWANISTLNQSAIQGKVVEFKYDAYVESGTDLQAGLDFGTHMGQWYGSAWNIILSSNGDVLYYDTTYHNAGTFTTNSWVPVRVVADYGTKTFDATVGALSFSGDFQTSSGNDTFAGMILCRDSGCGTSLYVDNLAITLVPEPGSLVMLVVGAFGLLAYAWRRRK